DGIKLDAAASRWQRPAATRLSWSRLCRLLACREAKALDATTKTDMNSTTSGWLVLNRPQVAGFELPGDTGGDENGWNLRSASYSANSVNQYTQREVPGYVDVMGISFATNTVTVNGQGTYRKGEFFRAELSVNNGSAPVWQSVAVQTNGVTGVSGHVF